MKLKLISLLVPVFVASGGYVQAKTGATSGVSAQIIRRFTEQIYQETQASGMAMIVIDGDKKFFTHAGQTRRGHDQQPQKNTLIRIASLTKLITSETLVKLEQHGQIRLSDPLRKYAPPGMTVPTYHGHVVTLQHMATHTAGLPRELPGGKPNRPIFI